ncbi:hypothetical protein GCM10010978_07710 [Compostibacillus humi]|uniref:Uncharacterized protein n=1 Tax=Compostibacillus humi TaxID=1245525 RepID=A0A8J3EJJ6_9BACI|nr:hypothetical protein [Compostibacillus humi]GGH71596.1 hypothetical protein GCM10010978_07710 [Compostibacillus humi]
MRCGAKCFLIQTEDADGKRQITSVNARTPAEARKRFREESGKDIQIISVREKKRSGST